MSLSIYWIKNQLAGKLGFKILNDNTGSFTHNGENHILYCPTTNEYEITIEVIIRASKLKADIVAYPTAWCKATREAIEFGRKLGVKVIPFSGFLQSYG